MFHAKDSTSTPDRRSRARRRRDAAAGGNTDHDLGGVTFRVRRLEPLLAWVLAGFILWLNIVSNASGTGFWLIAFLAACIGG